VPILNVTGHDRHHAVRLARVALSAFLFTFLSARIIVLLIMSHRVPDMYVHVKGTHVHHLNFGIILLSVVGAYLLFGRPIGKAASAAAVCYGVGLALTFDEFGMWVHLGGPYWQRASFDAVIIIAALLSLIAVAPTLHRFRPRNWWATALLVVGICAFAVLVSDVSRYAGRRFGPSLQQLEESGPM
jgi:hypothetical protein